MPAASPPDGRYPEIDCVRHWFSAARLKDAEARAARLGVGVDDVLIASGELSESAYMHAQAMALGLDFVDLDRVSRAHCPLDDEGLFRAARNGLLPLSEGGETFFVVARTGPLLRAFALAADRRPALRWRVKLTSHAFLRRFVERHTMQALRRESAFRLRDDRPDFSAAWPERRLAGALLVLLPALAAAFWLAPQAAANTLFFVLSTLFLAWAAFRLWLLRRNEVASPPAVDDLPVYTIVAALYREAKALPGLVAALDALDYPREKLQVILALEPDDYAMRDAVARLRLRTPYEIVLAPMPPPRGKPKALNAALPFVRGQFVVVYDAEDRPDPSQLREAAARFAADRGRRLACVQGRLTIDNSEDSWLTRVFTAEYAGHFDVMLPSLAAARLPIPLGGSSTHLRADILREVGAWDPYNVTEDADLGIRLARFGYRTAVASFSTFEEAPARPLPWLRQRTRWFKGWLQTWCVHMRHPARMMRELGMRNVLALHLFLFETVFVALIQPLGWMLIGLGLGLPDTIRPFVGELAPATVGFHVTALISGYLASIAVMLEGLRRRGLLSVRTALLLVALMPGYWLMLSVAAWRAFVQFFFNRFYWEKTEHGLARTSRRITIAGEAGARETRRQGS